MATVNVTECADIGGGMPGSGGKAPILNTASVVTMQSVTIGGAASAAFNASTTLVELYSTTACNVAFTGQDNATPTSSSPSFGLPASTPRQFGVKKGQKVIAF